MIYFILNNLILIISIALFLVVENNPELFKKIDLFTLFMAFFITANTIISFFRWWKRNREHYDKFMDRLSLAVSLLTVSIMVFRTFEGLNTLLYFFYFYALFIGITFEFKELLLILPIFLIVHVRELILFNYSTRSLILSVIADPIFMGLSFFAYGLYFKHIRAITLQEIEGIKDDYTERAKRYRLLSYEATEDGDTFQTKERQKLAEASSVQFLSSYIESLFSMIKKAAPFDSLALYMADEDLKSAVLAVAHAEKGHLKNQIVLKEGALASLIKQKSTIMLKNVPQSYSSLKYYNDTHRLKNFVATPVYNLNRLCGILIADNNSNKEFTEREKSIIEMSSKLISSAIEQETRLNQLHSALLKSTTFLNGIEALNACLDTKSVYLTMFEYASQLVEYDLATINLLDDDGKSMKIEAVSHRDYEYLIGRDIPENTSLVWLAVKNQSDVPYRQPYEKGTAFTNVFGEDIEINGVVSLKIFPLIVSKRTIGTFAIISTKKHVFTPRVTHMLDVMTGHCAIAIDNAKIYVKMRDMAITDGLTGLYNHRKFQEELDRMLYDANRYGNKLALILCDIDHFKSINDTYGHKTGDMVLKEVSKVMQKVARKTDIVARYGGEEFVIVLFGSDAMGGFNHAERIRKMIESIEFKCNLGKFKCTMSFGVAGFPEDAEKKEDLIEFADKALYYAKNHGRNQVVLFRDI